MNNMNMRTTKYRLLRLGLGVGNRTLAWALNHDLAPAAFALLETVGRSTGKPRQTPVGNGLDGDTFWLIAAHGHQADFVRNIQAHPMVRVKVGKFWRTGIATLLPDDNTALRSRALPHQWDAAIGRAIATTPLTIRIDLAPSATADRHPALEPIAFLLGTWRGTGNGHYPTMTPFGYREELVLGHVGQPSMTHARTTWLDDGARSHGEVGYWRVACDRVELVLSHHNGVVELAEGQVTGTTIELETTAVACTGSAKPVTALRRRYEVDGDTLRYEVWMAAVGMPLTHHLHGELRRG